MFNGICSLLFSPSVVCKYPADWNINFWRLTKMFRVCSTRFIQRTSIACNRNVSSTQSSQSNISKAPPPQGQSIPNVPGFSERVVNVPNHPVGYAGASKDTEYKNPEYYCYHVDSFGDSMLELEKYRLPAPSNKTKTQK